MNIKDYVKKIRKGELKTVNTIKSVLEKCKKLNKEYDCFVTICEKEALESAKKVNKKGKLAGVAITVKDAICVENVQSSAGSKILRGYKPPFDATVIARLKAEGAIIIGKTTQDEFGFGSFSTNSGYGIPKNPFDKNHSTGGSSGGCACITQLADFPHISIGESTGGSITCPSMFCGVYGLTPTYGLLSRYGLIDFANSLDKIGPMGKSTYDVALALNIMSGFDERDQTSLKVSKKDYTKFENVKGYTIGLPKEYFENVSVGVEKRVREAINVLKSLGVKFMDVSLKMTKYVIPTYYLTALSEASTNLARYDGVRFGAGLKSFPPGNYNNYYS